MRFELCASFAQKISAPTLVWRQDQASAQTGGRRNNVVVTVRQDAGKHLFLPNNTCFGASPSRPSHRRAPPVASDMEPLRLTCGASSDPVGRHSYVAPCLCVRCRTCIFNCSTQARPRPSLFSIARYARPRRSLFPTARFMSGPVPAPAAGLDSDTTFWLTTMRTCRRALTGRKTRC